MNKTQEEKFLEKYNFKDIVVCVETSKIKNVVVDPKPIFLTQVMRKYLEEYKKENLKIIPLKKINEIANGRGDSNTKIAKIKDVLVRAN